MSKQDRQGVRTPADIERKYDLGQDFSQIEKLAANAQRSAEMAYKTAAEANAAANKVTTDIEDIITRLEALEAGGSGGNSPLVVTADNISQYFSVTNGTYYFAGNGMEFTTNNGGVSSSTASTTLVALYDMDISFSYSYASESGYDKFTLKVGSTIVASALSGTTTAKRYEGSITAGTVLEFTYTKDSSGNSNGDKCMFWGMIISGEF